jgi:signal transduction histidine kinase
LEGDARIVEDQRRQVAGIRRGGKRLLGLIDEVLDLAGIEADRLELRPVAWDSGELLQELQGMFGGQAERKGIELRIERLEAVPPRVSCDVTRLHQILANLLDHAVKYTEWGTVILHAGFAEENLMLEGADTGIGIPTGEIEHIFEPSHQVDQGGRRSPGTGLGLTITKMLVERMAGSISVDSTPGQGTVFRARIPAQPVSIPDQDAGTPLSVAGVVGCRRTQGRGRLLIWSRTTSRRTSLSWAGCSPIRAMGRMSPKVASGPWRPWIRSPARSDST